MSTTFMGDKQSKPGATEHGQRDRQPPAFRKERQHEFRYVLAVRVAACASMAVSTLPRWLRELLSTLIADLFFASSTTYRRNVTDNIRQVVGPAVDDAGVAAMAKNAFRLSAQNFADVIRTPRTPIQELVGTTALARGSWSILDNALAEGKGAIIITAHIGGFDHIGQSLNARGYKLTTVTGRTTTRFIYDGITHLRRSRGAGIVEATPSGVRAVMQALRRGECAGFVTDRDFFQNGKPVAFFGRATTLPPGAVRIARDTGAPIVPIFARHISGGHAISIHPSFRVERTDDMERDIARGMARVVAVLESAIAEAPEQWLMFHEVWPSAPVDPVRVFPVGSPLESELFEKVASALPEPRPRRDRRSPIGRTVRRRRSSH